jgi:hypothetical protein
VTEREVPWDAELGLYPPAADDPLWWLSFADPEKPQGQQFLGGLITQARTFPAALTRSWAIGVNPGGEVAYRGPIPASYIGPQWRDRLLTKEEVMSVPPPDCQQKIQSPRP